MLISHISELQAMPLNSFHKQLSDGLIKLLIKNSIEQQNLKKR